MFIHPKFVYKQKMFPKFLSFFFSKNTPKYDKLSKISNISIKTILELPTKFGNFGNFGNFGHISDRLRTIHNTCSNLIGSEPLYILPTGLVCISNNMTNVVFIRYAVFLYSFHACLGKYELTVATYNIWNVMFNWEIRQLRIAQLVAYSNVMFLDVDLVE